MRQSSLKSFLKKLFLMPVFVYQKLISPLFPASCRYTPTCSTYAIQAIERHGIIQGSKLTLKRLARCQPWGSHGYDPVPKVLIKKYHPNRIIAKAETFVNEMGNEPCESVIQ